MFIDKYYFRELKQEEEKKKKHEIWLKEREEKINEIQRAWRPLSCNFENILTLPVSSTNFKLQS